MEDHRLTNYSSEPRGSRTKAKISFRCNEAEREVTVHLFPAYDEEEFFCPKCKSVLRVPTIIPDRCQVEDAD